MKRYPLQILIALDQLGTALCGGWADETISSYLWRLERSGKPAGLWLRPVVDVLFSHVVPSRSAPFFVALVDVQHCRLAYVAERTRAQLPPEFRSSTKGTM